MATPRDASTPSGPGPTLVPGQDYYLEHGNLVFTAHYHLKRGFCCNSKCRHCPYKEGTMPNLAVAILGADAPKSGGT